MAAKQLNFALNLTIGSYSKALLPSVQRSKERATIGLCCSIFFYFPFSANISNCCCSCRCDSDDSDVVAGDASYISSSSLLLLLLLSAVIVTVHLREHPWYGVAYCRQELHATISSVVVSRYARLDSFVVKHIALFSLEDEFEGRFRILAVSQITYTVLAGT